MSDKPTPKEVTIVGYIHSFAKLNQCFKYTIYDGFSQIETLEAFGHPIFKKRRRGLIKVRISLSTETTNE